MANTVFQLGSLDLSQFIRVNPGEGFNPGQGDMLDPAFSDSPLFEGQVLTSLHAKNKEIIVPLYLHPPTAPYTNTALNQLVQQVNAALRPIVDTGTTINAVWQNAQAAFPTNFTVQFGRFEPDFNFRVSEKGWLAGKLHLWVTPYGHTATERILGTWTAPTMQSGIYIPAASMLAAGGTVVGDVSPQFDIRVGCGSSVGFDGRIAIIAALPQPSYTPIVPVGSFTALAPSSVIYGGSGAWGSQFLAMNSWVGSQGAAAPAAATPNGGGGFSFALGPASVYQGDNRVLGLVKSRSGPYGLRAFDPGGQPLGPTVIASACDGWQLVDYGILRVPPWMATAVVRVNSYAHLLDVPPFTASGFVWEKRWPAPWTQEHGPIFVVPNGYSIMDLDFNSYLVGADGFDGQGGNPQGVDLLGNQWITNWVGASGPYFYSGLSQLALFGGDNVADWLVSGGTVIDPTRYKMEAELTFQSQSTGMMAGVGFGQASYGGNQNLGPFSEVFPGVSWSLWAGNTASTGNLIACQALAGTQIGIFTLKVFYDAAQGIWANLGTPSGVIAGSASQIMASMGVATQRQYGTYMQPIITSYNGVSATKTAGVMNLESFRARMIPSTGQAPNDSIRLYQPQAWSTRRNSAGVDVVDLQQRQRGPVQAVSLTPPSMSGGLFIAEFPWDQGPANDLLTVDVRVRERFTYAR